jgi:CDP-diacylglycerol--serine O-phosphatidyltransferase
MKNIPNYITLLNLLLGILAIIFCLQNGIIPVQDDGEISGYRIELQPEKLYLASLFIFLAAVADFFDGFAARLLHANGEMGKQLDSLADVVSFGVAPSIIIYQFLRLSLAAEEDGLNASIFWLVPAFAPALAAAWRLARFNIDVSTPSHYFRGTPVPSAGLAIAGLPLIWWQASEQWEIDILTNKWALYLIAITISILMVSNLPIMSNKPRGKGASAFLPQISVLVTAIVAALFLGWWAVPVTFASFVIFSIVFKKKIIQ